MILSTIIIIVICNKKSTFKLFNVPIAKTIVFVQCAHLVRNRQAIVRLIVTIYQTFLRKIPRNRRKCIILRRVLCIFVIFRFSYCYNSCNPLCSFGNILSLRCYILYFSYLFIRHYVCYKTLHRIIYLFQHQTVRRHGNSRLLAIQAFEYVGHIFGSAFSLAHFYQCSG